jgi:hypothetical protein
MMSRMMMFFWIICFSFNASASAEIIEAYSLEEVKSYFDTLDSHSLVMWDVDHTLIVPADRVLRPGNEAIARQLGLQYMGKKSTEKWRELSSQLLNCLSYTLVDSDLPSLIISLQKKKIPVMAFTAMRTGKYGIIPSMENWRIQQLKQFEIDFSRFLPHHSGLSWQENTRGTPAFKEGILCSDGLNKGQVLDNFLKKIDWKPTYVIFFDDVLECLTSVEKTLNALNIPFIGIHFHAAKSLGSPVDMEIAHYQYKNLVEKGIWPSDQEAQLAVEKMTVENSHP